MSSRNAKLVQIVHRRTSSYFDADTNIQKHMPYKNSATIFSNVPWRCAFCLCQTIFVRPKFFRRDSLLYLVVGFFSLLVVYLAYNNFLVLIRKLEAVCLYAYDSFDGAVVSFCAIIHAFLFLSLCSFLACAVFISFKFSPERRHARRF